MSQRISDLIILLSSGINQRRMYFDNHPKVESLSIEFVEKLQSMLKENGQTEFSFGVLGSKFIHQGKYLVGPSIIGKSLIEFAENLGCGGFVFRLPIDKTDLALFFRQGAKQKDRVENLETARALFSSVGLGHIELSEPLTEGDEKQENQEDQSESDDGDDSDFLASDFVPLLRAYQSLYETVASNNIAATSDNSIDLDNARSNGEKLVSVSDKGALDVMQFMRYPDFDSYTIGHSVRVAALGAILARELGWSRELQNEIATAGLLHDLGKGKVPEDILFKPGSLTGDERKIIETHPELGARILLANGETNPIVLSAAWGHHLGQDGSGYPAMPPWFVRSSAAALIHVCDIFEALTAVRPYKNPMDPRRAYEIMLKNRKSYHPVMLAGLIRALGLYPPGSEVVLSDQRRAVVVAKGPAPELPLVRVTHDVSGERITSQNQPALHLDQELDLRVADCMLVGTSVD